MPSPPECRLEGGLTSFTSCNLVGTTFVVVTDQNSQPGEITFSVKNIINPSAGETEPFSIIIFYDNKPI